MRTARQKFVKINGVMKLNPEYKQWKAPEKFVTINGVMKLNPEHKKWKETTKETKDGAPATIMS
jgi:hypothetical protein